MTVLETLPWEDVGKFLRVPRSKCDAIALENFTDRQRLAAVIQYWILRAPYASWRKLINRLDRNDKCDIADKIRKYAEKQTGQ